MQLLERTQECEPKYNLWPYKRQNTGGSITKNYRCIDFTMMHICTNLKEIRQEMQLLERTQECDAAADAADTAAHSGPEWQQSAPKFSLASENILTYFARIWKLISWVT